MFLHADRFYHELPGYYYLHQAVPFYDRQTVQIIGETTPHNLTQSASHILSENPGLVIPGYRIEREFGKVRIWRREMEDLKIREWENYTPNVAGNLHGIMTQADPQSPTPPAAFGIRFAN